MAFESPLNNAIPNPRPGCKDHEEGSHLRVPSPKNYTDNSKSNYQEKRRKDKTNQKGGLGN